MTLRTLAPWPHFAPDEVEAAAATLRSGKVNYWTGPEGKLFEAEFAAYHGRKHGVAMSNGTVTMEAALHALGVGAGDEVIVPSRTFIASASCIVAIGARPVVADVDPISGNLTAETAQAAMSSKTKAIIPVHIGGWPCEMTALLDLASDKGVHVFEDCAQAHGAKYRGKLVGGFGIASSFSFCQDKVMTTAGEGGMLLVDDPALFRSAWARKDHGKGYDTVHKEHPPGFRWLHDTFGTNDRMTEVQAAIGRIQLRKLEGWVTQRRRNAERLAGHFAKAGGLVVPMPPSHMDSAWYKLYPLVEPAALRKDWTRDRIMVELNTRGVPCTVGSCAEIYKEKAFIERGWGRKQPLPNAKTYGDRSLMFQVHPTLGDEDMDWVGAQVTEVMRDALL